MKKWLAIAGLFIVLPALLLYLIPIKTYKTCWPNSYSRRQELVRGGSLDRVKRASQQLETDWRKAHPNIELGVCANTPVYKLYLL